MTLLGIRTQCLSCFCFIFPSKNWSIAFCLRKTSFWIISKFVFYFGIRILANQSCQKCHEHRRVSFSPETTVLISSVKSQSSGFHLYNILGLGSPGCCDFHWNFDGSKIRQKMLLVLTFSDDQTHLWPWHLTWYFASRCQCETFHIWRNIWRTSDDKIILFQVMHVWFFRIATVCYWSPHTPLFRLKTFQFYNGQFSVRCQSSTLFGNQTPSLGKQMSFLQIMAFVSYIRIEKLIIQKRPKVLLL